MEMPRDVLLNAFIQTAICSPFDLAVEHCSAIYHSAFAVVATYGIYALYRLLTRKKKKD